ncbi:Piso0_000492 [Millerozyma farinosa CBS 7064]|uniref:ubiquitinyl hydrolase 1 n=1 Tax=Pichia sorbitophila (strain ATCC MYA-4447 / BCRC 22081 / CBS 7064 / NBRC 10061 / NRRL Y-12695) TaxID=559304 RepID=G8YVK7_PICSO|nr:Piso0_000492 [Millerozyma farinosa CBS 7064]CCE73451.1 Piso0_000492 [Millerozyma farinosa CBS 7064]
MASPGDLSSSSVAPYINRILSSPMTFVPAKQPEGDDIKRPENYMVLLKKAGERPGATAAAPGGERAALGSPRESKKPRSMAEAVAAYTGRKFMGKTEKQGSKRRRRDEPQQLVDSEEDLGQDVAAEPLGERSLNESDSSSDSRYESASEYPDVALGEARRPKQDESRTVNGGSSKDPEKLDQTGVDGGRGTSSGEEDTAEDEEDEDDEDDASAEISSSDASEESDAESDKLSPEEVASLKKDLLEDAASAGANGSQQEIQRDSKVEEADASLPAKSSGKTTESSEEDAHTEGFPVSAFYGINEKENDRGANGSNRIYKNWRELSKRKPAGLLNHGVTCYMNSAIQALVHIAALQHYLNEINAGKHNNTLKPRSVSHVLALLSRKMWGLDDEGDGRSNPRFPKYINPKKIIQRLPDINCMMSEWQQEDSHEYFMSLISRLQEDSTPKGSKLNTSIIYDIFGGLLHQSVTCRNCNHVSDTKQEFYDLSLGFTRKRHQGDDPDNENTDNQKYSIEKSIKDFFSKESIKLDRKDKSSGYYCEKCKTRSNAFKVSTIDRSPEALAIHLKRFKFNGNSSSKVKQPIHYSKYLDLSRYTSSVDPTKYQLISVITHEGRSISSGHYVAHCLQPDNTWSTYDDEYINKINEREALSDPSAYVLLYTKLTPKPKKRVNEGTKEPQHPKKRKI